jgi:AcrR family transcriptional regulator/flavodoxin
MPRFKTDEQEQMRSETRQRLLNAATVEFARVGYDRANIDKISKAAGFAKGTVYNYFESKRALMLDLIDLIAASHFEFVAQLVTEETGPVSRLHRFFEAGFEWTAENLPQGRVMITTLNGPDEEFKVHMFHAYGPMFQLVANEILAPGVEGGQFRKMDPASTAGMIMTIYLGFGTTVNDQGRPNVAPIQISDFVLNALRRLPKSDSEEGPTPPKEGYADMNSLVAYFSKFGNTRQVAEVVAQALGSEGSVRLVSLDQLKGSDLEGMDLVVMGAPTHRMNLPEPVRPVFGGLGRRSLRRTHMAAFDTSYRMSPFLARFTAAKKLARKLRKLGGQQTVPPETFHVEGREGPLYEGEIDRAKAWAESILDRLGRR